MTKPPIAQHLCKEIAEPDDCGHACGVTQCTRTFQRTIAGHLFVATLPAVQCNECNFVTFDNSDVEQFEAGAARELMSGTMSAEAFRFARTLLVYTQRQLAELLGVAFETVSHWESGRLPINKLAWFTLGLLVADESTGGRAVTAEKLRRIDVAELPEIIDLRQTLHT